MITDSPYDRQNFVAGWDGATGLVLFFVMANIPAKCM